MKPVGRDNDMGTEVNATVTLALQKGLNFSVTGAYAFLGDFVRDTFRRILLWIRI